MNNQLRLTLLSALLLLVACLVSFPEPAQAKPLCENIHGNTCNPSTTLSPARTWGFDGAWARCGCDYGKWNCTYPDGLG